MTKRVFGTLDKIFHFLELGKEFRKNFPKDEVFWDIDNKEFSPSFRDIYEQLKYLKGSNKSAQDIARP